MAPSPSRCLRAIAVLAHLGMAKPGPAEWSAHPHFLGSREGPVAGYSCDCEAVTPPCALRLAGAEKPVLGMRVGGWPCPQPSEAILPVTAGTPSRTLIYLLLITRASDGFCYFQDVFSISF